MNLIHTPRLYVHDDLSVNHTITLSDDATHYLKNVLRLKDGETVRVFNGRAGEYAAIWVSTGKKTSALTIGEITRSLEQPVRASHLFFPLIKKDRMDWLVEKAVELGVTDLHPILTDHATVRDMREDRVRKQVIEAAEQCERLTIPTIHKLTPMKQAIEAAVKTINIMAAVERRDAAPIKDIKTNAAENGFLFGPEGGFSESEKQWLQTQKLHIVSLGDNILRAETAGLMGVLHII